MIEVVDLHATLKGQRVLRGVNLKIDTGEVVALIGRSGEGKSVLVKHIVRLMKGDRGRIIVDGEDITHAKGKRLEKVREKMGYLFQEGALFDSYTVFENVAFPLVEKTDLPFEKIREIVLYELEQVGLKGMEHKYPAELSGGMKKRAALARCMVLKPKYMFFDEPTTGLDPLTARSIHRLIRETYERTRFTGIIISHDIPEIFSLVHKVAMLHEGRIIFYGTPSELERSDNPIVREFIEAALEEHNPLGRSHGEELQA